MFSSKYKQLLSLQNDYIERINKNAVKLEKQLDFLNKVNKSLTKQLGGAGQKEEGTTVAQVTEKDQPKETDKDQPKETDKNQPKETDKDEAKESDRPEQFEDASPGPSDEDKDKETKKEENPMENLSPMQSIQVKNQIVGQIIEMQTKQNEKLKQNLENLKNTMDTIDKSIDDRLQSAQKMLENSKALSGQYDKQELTEKQKDFIRKQFEKLNEDEKYTISDLRKKLNLNPNEKKSKKDDEDSEAKGDKKSDKQTDKRTEEQKKEDEELIEATVGRDE